jgi:hypothetical protein
MDNDAGWKCLPVRKWRILRGVPEARKRKFAVEPAFRLGFIIHTVEADDPLQKDMKLGM